MKLSETKYQNMVNYVRQVYKDNNVILLSEPDDFGINKYFPSDSDQIEFFFYGFGLSEIRTPIGQITPLGGYGGSEFEENAMNTIVDYFGLQLTHTNKYTKIYIATKNVPQ